MITAGPGQWKVRLLLFGHFLEAIGIVPHFLHVSVAPGQRVLSKAQIDGLVEALAFCWEEHQGGAPVTLRLGSQKVCLNRGGAAKPP